MPNAQVYSELIRNATLLNDYHKANVMVNKVLYQEKITSELLKSVFLRNAILIYYANALQIEQGLKFMRRIVDEFGEKALNERSYAIMMSGMGSIIKDKKRNSKYDQLLMVEAAERLFNQSFKVLDRVPDESVFGA